MASQCWALGITTRCVLMHLRRPERIGMRRFSARAMGGFGADGRRALDQGAGWVAGEAEQAHLRDLHSPHGLQRLCQWRAEASGPESLCQRSSAGAAAAHDRRDGQQHQRSARPGDGAGGNRLAAAGCHRSGLSRCRCGAASSGPGVGIGSSAERLPTPLPARAQSPLRVRPFCGRPQQPDGPCGGFGCGRSTGPGVQPPVHLRRCGPGQNPPDASHWPLPAGNRPRGSGGLCLHRNLHQ